MNDVPMDANHLPDYAAKVVEHYRQHPEIMRLVTWARLERGPDAGKLTGLLDAYQRKVEAVAQAQKEGKVSDRFPAATLLELILCLIQTNAEPSAEFGDQDEFQRRQQAVKDAVALLVQV